VDEKEMGDSEKERSEYNDFARQFDLHTNMKTSKGHDFHKTASTTANKSIATTKLDSQASCTRRKEHTQKLGAKEQATVVVKEEQSKTAAKATAQKDTIPMTTRRWAITSDATTPNTITPETITPKTKGR
jgi:predicted deacylase